MNHSFPSKMGGQLWLSVTRQGATAFIAMFSIPSSFPASISMSSRILSLVIRAYSCVLRV